MRKQSGYIDVQIGGLLILGGIIGAVFTIAVYIIASWAWPFIKAFVHQITA
jgi:hypothetical protein